MNDPDFAEKIWSLGQNMKKTKWASVPINEKEFLAKGYNNLAWEKYNSDISTKGVIYVRREITILD